MPARAEAQEFKKHFEEAMAHNDKVLEEEEEGGEGEARSLPSYHCRERSCLALLRQRMRPGT